MRRAHLLCRVNDESSRELTLPDTTVPFAGPDGRERHLVVSPPPEPLHLLPHPDADRAVYIEAVKRMRLRLGPISRRAMAGTLRRLSRIGAADGSLADAVHYPRHDPDRMVIGRVAVVQTQDEPPPGSPLELEDADNLVAAVFGRDRDGIRLRVTMSVARGLDFDPVALAGEWLDRLEAVQGF